MSGVNGVHSLLAFLLSRLQVPRAAGDKSPELASLDMLLKESKQLNETLFRLEKALPNAETPTDRNAKLTGQLPAAPEGHWPTASVVRDTINQQERQRAFGHWNDGNDVLSDVEPFTHRVVQEAAGQAQGEPKQVLVQRYVPTEDDAAIANISSNLIQNRQGLRRDAVYGNEDLNSPDEAKSRILLIGLGMAMILSLLLFTW